MTKLIPWLKFRHITGLDSRCNRLRNANHHSLSMIRSISSSFTRSPHRRAIPVHRFTSVESEDVGKAPPLLDHATLGAIRRILTPIVLLAPEPNELTRGQSRPKSGGLYAKRRRAAPAAALHDELSAASDTLCVYTDASVRCDAGNHAGAGITIPSVNRTCIHYLGVYAQPRRSLMAEFAAVVLGLEQAAINVAGFKKIVLFTDSQHEKPVTSCEWTDPLIARMFARASSVLQELHNKGISFKVYWVPGHREVIDGIIVSHRAAREASRPFTEIEQRLVYGPHLVAGVAFENVGTVSLAQRHLYMPALPRKHLPNGLATDGMTMRKPLPPTP